MGYSFNQPIESFPQLLVSLTLGPAYFHKLANLPPYLEQLNLPFCIPGNMQIDSLPRWCAIKYRAEFPVILLTED